MKEYYLKKADENLPNLTERNICPDVECSVLKSGDEITLDFGNHYVGYFSFYLDYIEEYIDAPVRLSVKFCETKQEISDDFSAYNGGLCASWLQEEIINIDFTGKYEMPRRYAARYIKITVLSASKRFKLSGFTFKSVTSADENNLKKYSIKDEELNKIDLTAVNTLKNCMQRVFEDGPKRDRRLWIGDLRLEALTNYYTFDKLSVVRRCLYLFAAADTNSCGFIPGYVYENPSFVSGYWFLMDYALLYVVCACDYYMHTKDLITFNDIYPVIKKQMNAADAAIDKDGIISIKDDCDAFIDWCEGLEKITSLHGVYLYTLKSLIAVLTELNHEDKDLFIERYESAKNAASDILYNKGSFVNQKDNFQESVHSAVWMILGDVVDGEDAKKILINVLQSESSKKPFTPYMHHYVLEAMFKLSMADEAVKYMKKIWGGMLDRGADTFFEVFVPDDAEFSPYGNRMMNSMCHAWSCTPAYFIRRFINTSEENQ